MDKLQMLLSDDQTFESLMHAIANGDQSEFGSCGGGTCTGGGGGECGSCQVG